MRGVWLASLRVTPSYGVKLPYQLRVRFPCLGCRYFFDAIATPQTVAVTERRNSALGADACASQDKDAVLSRYMNSCAHASSVAEKHHKAEIHMALLVAVEERHAGV